MAKKVKKQPPKDQLNELPENVLPQNILPVGERVEENKNIYISQTVYKQIHKFTQNKTTNESGGVLVGTVIEEFGKTNIVISGFVEAKFCEATPTTLKFTHETWEYVHKEIEKKHKDKKILGWIHTHPDFGIFLSEYDKFIHQNFFSEAYQVAYVVDPVQNIEGFYFWINGNIEKCKGFYIYDKTGTKITVDIGKEDSEAERKNESVFSANNILLAVLTIAVLFLIFSNISTNNKLRKLEREQENLNLQQITLADRASQALFQMEQTIAEQAEEIQGLKDVLKEAGILVEEIPEVPEVTEEPASEETESETAGQDSEENTAETTDAPAESATAETDSAETTDASDVTEGSAAVNE